MAGKLATLAKMARGIGSMDEGLEMLSAMGIESEVTPIPMEQQPTTDELAELAKLAMQPGAQFYRLVMKHESGMNLSAFVVTQGFALSK